MTTRICPECRTKYQRGVGAVCPRDGAPLVELSCTFSSAGGSGAKEEDTFVGAGLMIGEYRIEGMLAEGGMGVVYAGVHPLISKRVAIKVINRRFATDLKAVSRFVLEARSVNEIGHHNIVDIFAIGELDDGRNYLVMELIDGVNLHEVLHAAGRLAAGEVLPVYEQLCDALEAAHRKGFIHRDLKPANIVVLRRPPHPFVKILDFGLAKLRGPSLGEETAVGTVVGTPSYMAPEQCRGDEVDPRTDVYALGVMLYELLTGRPPFVDALPQRVLAMHIQDPARPPSQLVPEIAPALEQVVLRALAKNPARRQRSAHELYLELRAAIPAALPWSHLLEDLRPTTIGPLPAMDGALAGIPIALPPVARRDSALAPELLPSSMLSGTMDAIDDGETTRRVDGVPSQVVAAMARAPAPEVPLTLPPGAPAPPSIDSTLEAIERRDETSNPEHPRQPPVLVSTRTMIGLGDFGRSLDADPLGSTDPSAPTPEVDSEIVSLVALPADEDPAFGETQPLPQIDELAPALLADTRRVPAISDAPTPNTSPVPPERPAPRSEPGMVLELGEPSGEISLDLPTGTLPPGRRLVRRRRYAPWIVLGALLVLGAAATAFVFLR